MADLPRPIKQHLRSLGIQLFDAFESQLMSIICQRFGLQGDMPDSVKTADLVLLATEARDLMVPMPDGCWPNLVGVGAIPNKIVPEPCKEAERMFLSRFYELTKHQR